MVTGVRLAYSSGVSSVSMLTVCMNKIGYKHDTEDSEESVMEDFLVYYCYVHTTIVGVLLIYWMRKKCRGIHDE